ncbi:pyridoxal phosphate-dependent aminotransferase [Halobaculum sp. CBA1158]|uniref:pyridoxal phosphate-dependent aminotransferase n=1 Tax=Halobaculum sp. CBA1158 TaxID=2904243 RepID=UPI001F2BEA54|nr:pyridoxal phosphate-dependent aminotransferase [Halobaculum sp. CBA1158]UIO98808.1 pyridoxal phosphate-dependent aminotransferase [Halobaculum sp. CBA1158]
MFPPLAYIDWIEGRPGAADHDLGSSDLRPAGPDDSADPIPSRLRGLAPPASDATLRERVADEYGVAPDRVLATAGATHAGFLAAATAAALARERSDADRRPRALVEDPGYEPLVKTPRGLGTRVERFERPGPRAPLDPERIAGAADGLTGPLAHATVTNRHNPTGRLTDRETLAATAEVVADRGGHLVVDEVYAPYTVGRSDEASGDRRGGTDPRTAFGGPTAAGLPATVAVGSLTKFHGLGGLRVGWLVGPEPFVDRARTVERHVPGLATPSASLARRFFAHRDELVAEARDYCRRNHDLLAGFLADRRDLEGVVADDSPFGVLRHESADGDAVAEAAWDAGVLVVPGRFFGVPDGVRVSLGRAPDDCAAALDALGRVLDGL